MLDLQTSFKFRLSSKVRIYFARIEGESLEVHFNCLVWRIQKNPPNDTGICFNFIEFSTMLKYRLSLLLFSIYCSSFYQASKINQHVVNEQKERDYEHQSWAKASNSAEILTGIERIKRVDKNAVKKCDVPTGPDLSFTIHDSEKHKLNITKQSKIPAFSKLEITCKSGSALSDGTKVQRSVCDPDDGWFPRPAPCLKTCPALHSENMDLKCSRENVLLTKCEGVLISGTKVQPACKPLHGPEKYVTYRELRCQSNGKWDNDLYKCVPECGIISEVTGFIHDGQETSVQESPWHVAIFKISSNYTLVCGGTLISTHLVISAAHCFYDLKNDLVRSKSDYEIIIGKYQRDYKKIDDSQKKLKIRELKVHPKFDPIKAGHYGHDIAVLILDEAVKITKYSLPACLDWRASQGFNPGDGTDGKLVGWGFVGESNSFGIASEHLLSATLPFFSYNSCVGKLTPLPNDQFCAGSDSGPGARKGDSGGGLIFLEPTTHRYFIRGIVSTGKKDGISTASFTDISYHLSWLEEIRNAINELSSVINTGQSGVFQTTESNTKTTTQSTAEIDDICPVANNDGKSCLQLAALRGDINAAKILINKGADINAKDKHGRNILFYVADGTIESSTRLDLMRYLLNEKKADVFQKDNYGSTLLHQASWNGALDVAKYLVEQKGLDINARNNEGRTPLMDAVEQGKEDVAKYLLEEKSADFRIASYDGRTCLHMAALRGHVNMVKLLVEKGGDMNAKDQHGRSPVFYASDASAGGRNHVDILRYFVDEKKADIYQRDKYRSTLLHEASWTGDFDVAKYLVEQKGFNVNEKNNDGRTPLRDATEQNKVEVAEYLKSKGGVLNRRRRSVMIS